MSPGESGRLVILSGPSCVGKSALYECLGKFYPELRNRFHRLVLVNSRDPRPEKSTVGNIIFGRGLKLRDYGRTIATPYWRRALTCKRWMLRSSSLC